MKPFLVIGDGQLARHLLFYFDLLKIKWIQWSRSQSEEANLKTLLPSVSAVLLAIKDDSLISFYKSNFSNLSAPEHLIPFFHFSGSMIIPDVLSLHPLFSFSSNEPYPLSVYESIPFILDRENFSNTSSFIKHYFKNPLFSLSSNEKPLYHSLCVMAHNFTKVFLFNIKDQFENQINIPSSALNPILNELFNDIINNNRGSLSGPLARKDFKTIELHKKALKNNPLEVLYHSFLDYYLKQNFVNLTSSQNTRQTGQNENCI